MWFEKHMLKCQSRAATSKFHNISFLCIAIVSCAKKFSSTILFLSSKHTWNFVCVYIEQTANLSSHSQWSFWNDTIYGNENIRSLIRITFEYFKTILFHNSIFHFSFAMFFFSTIVGFILPIACDLCARILLLSIRFHYFISRNKQF